MRNNIFTDPKGWAQMVVGSPIRYRLMQAMSVVLGACLAGMLSIICWEADLPLVGYLSVLVFLVGAVIVAPLCYLRALRCFVVESQLNSLHSRPR